MAYISVSELKSHLGVTTTGDDALLTSLIASATAIINRHTRRVFEAPTDTTKTLDAIMPYVNGRWLHVSEVGDLCTITSVVNGDGATLTTAVYVTEPRNVVPNMEPIRAIKLKDASAVAWTWTGTPEAAISVTGRWAYSVTAPPEIAAVCREMAALMYKRRDTNSDINRPVIAGNATILPAGLSAESMNVLRSLRRLR